MEISDPEEPAPYVLISAVTAERYYGRVCGWSSDIAFARSSSMIHDRPTPNLFMVGAPKCGTTSMYHYLRQHPQIFFPFDDAKLGRAKEPHYFCPELEIGERDSIKDEGEYLDLYRGSEYAKWRGDASVLYLFSEQAASRIKQFCPDARILIMLRPPVEQMHSRHAHCIRHITAREDITDFYEAIAAGEDRRNGLRIPPHTTIPKCLDYFSVARFAPQVERYFDTFGRDAMKVVLLEDMVAAPKETYRQLLAFLQVDDSFAPEFRAYNEAPAQTPLERAVHRVYRNSAVKRVVQAIAPYQARRRVLNGIRVLARGRKQRLPRDEELYQRCRPDVERLARLLERDLSHWL